MDEEIKKPRPHLVVWLRDTSIFFANWLSISAFGLLAVNFSFANWSLNPIDDLLYVRTQGFILPANHVSSAWAILLVTGYFIAKDPRHIAKRVFLIFSTASIHEYTLDALNLPTMFAAHTLSYTITFRWFFWLGFFLIPAIILANSRQRRIMLYIFLFCFAYMGIWILGAEALNIDTYTILAFAPGPAYNQFIPNFFEVTSWVIPSSMWPLLDREA